MKKPKRLHSLANTPILGMYVDAVRWVHGDRISYIRCWDVQNSIFGRQFNGKNPIENIEFEKAGGYEKCSDVVKKIARLAGEST